MKKNKKIIFLDGAMGTSLSARGADPTPISNVQNPGTVKEIYKEYIKAGADIIESNTFSATSLKYENFRKINRLGVQLAKEAIKESGRKNVKIAGSIGATGYMVKPVGKLDFEEAVKVFKEQIKVIFNEGVDLFILETMDDISEMRAALIALKEAVPKVPVISTMTFAENERTSTGTPPEVAAKVMDSLGASVIGVNCSFGPEKLVKVVEKMRRVTKKPIIAQANAGIPEFIGGKTVYPIAPKEYAHLAKKLVRAGASYIGGCCGTTPEHITVLVEKLKDMEPPKSPDAVPLIITSRTKWAEFSEFPVVIGERINFIAHKELKKSNEKVVSEGLKQYKAGAAALDVNLGRDEERTWEIVDVLSRRADVPLVLDSQNPKQIEKAARYYPGVILLNSISGEEKKLKDLLPAAKKYGIPFIALCLDDKGVPKSVRGKIKVLENIISSAKKYGIGRESIVADPLTLAVAADPDASVNTLKAVSKIAQNTILGISNISMGMPDRALLNQTFSVLAVQAGCSALIVNPLDRELMYGIYAGALLCGKDKNAGNYLRYFSVKEKAFSFDNPLSQAILEGNTENAVKEVRKIMKNTPALRIIEKYVIPGLDIVGLNYNERKIFLPQLIESAQAAQAVMVLIEKKLAAAGTKIEKRAKILIATVKGDIHDIGKNLVALILRNHSFDIKDMGVDVDSNRIVEEAKKWGADIIALSSLMTTTMGAMEKVISVLKKENKKIPVIIGGAAITRQYADSIGAYYGKDAVEAIKVARDLLKK